MKHSFLLCIIGLCLLLNTLSFASPLYGKDKAQWEASITHSIDFFNLHAWDSKSGSYASDINLDGSKKSETRHLIALSRMIYGLAHSAYLNPSNLDKAKITAAFLLKNMVKKDPLGSYFIPAVDANGIEVIDKSTLDVSEQAYGLNGLIALYQVTHDPSLLSSIRALYASFYKRFHDDVNKGFFDGYDLISQKPITTKSYSSTVYVATAFLMELEVADKENTVEYQQTLTELSDIVTRYFVDEKTGWIIENFTADWKPDWRDWQKQGNYTIGIVGHNFQAAWFLMRMATLTTDQTKSSQYRNAGKKILSSMLEKPVIDWENGGFYDAFKRETSEPMWHTNKAWWQQAEAILALTLAEKMQLISTRQALLARDLGIQFYFKHFIDTNKGGEFDVVNREGTPLSDSMKGHRGKSSYHSVEMARYMIAYSTQD